MVALFLSGVEGTEVFGTSSPAAAALRCGHVVTDKRSFLGNSLSSVVDQFPGVFKVVAGVHAKKALNTAVSMSTFKTSKIKIFFVSNRMTLMSSKWDSSSQVLPRGHWMSLRSRACPGPALNCSSDSQVARGASV